MIAVRIIALAMVVLTCRDTAPAAPTPSDLERARRLLADAILFDGHNDLPWAIRTDKKAHGDITAYDLRTRTAGQTDLPRLRQGGVSAQFWSVYVPGELKGGFEPVRGADSPWQERRGDELAASGAEAA